MSAWRKRKKDIQLVCYTYLWAVLLPYRNENSVVKQGAVRIQKWGYEQLEWWLVYLH
jgi:hypothetical protein